MKLYNLILNVSAGLAIAFLLLGAAGAGPFWLAAGAVAAFIALGMAAG